MFEQHIPAIEKKIGYTFRDKNLLRQAFTRSSYENEHPDECRSNEVLEFFGDTVLSCAIVSHLIDKFTVKSGFGITANFREGNFSNVKSKLSDKKNLSASMMRLGLQTYLLLGEGDRIQDVADEPSVMEDLFESIIGAVFIDSGKDMIAVGKVVDNMLDVGKYLTDAAPTIQSYKNALQEFCAAKQRRLPLPEYTVINESGPDHMKTFTVRCSVAGYAEKIATGKNRKTAENLAAQKTFQELTERERKMTTAGIKNLYFANKY
ncbi:MAG: ribonuclease III [Clostridia bacterium]|nr:ribonuclease III [Clostridia bacterium]